MRRLTRDVMIAIIAAAAIGYILTKLRNRHRLANQTVDAIEAQIRALDPVTSWRAGAEPGN